MSEESLADNSRESSYDSCLVCTIEVDEGDCYFQGWLDPTEQLEAFLEEYSARPVDRRNSGCLQFRNVVITRYMITLLRRLFGSDEASSSLNGHNENSEGAQSSTTATIFSAAHVENSCQFFSRADATGPDDEELVCTPDDKYFFFSALARCTEELIIEDNHPDFLSDLLNIPEIHHLEAETLRIAHHVSLEAFEYLRLGAIIQNSVRTTCIYLKLPFGNAPQAFCTSFSKCIHIQSLTVNYLPQMSRENEAMAKIIANEDGNGALEGLLRNPQNQLTALTLDVTTLEDIPAMVIAQLLPNSNVSWLSLFSKNTHPTAPLLEFTRQLPKMHSIIGFSLDLSSSVEFLPEVLEECGASLLQGIIQNPFMQHLGSLDNFPQRALLYHYLYLNRAGRRILLEPSSNGERPIPDGLWPHILSRAARLNWEYQSFEVEYNGPPNAVYFFLRNCPKIFSWHE